MLSFPLKFTGRIFFPDHKPFGGIPQAHSLNLWSLFGICVAWGPSASFLTLGAHGVNVSQGREHQQPQEHSSAFSISFPPTDLFLSSLGGKAVTFFTEEAGKAKGTNCPGTSWRRRKWGQSSPNCCTREIGPNQIFSKSHQEKSTLDHSNIQPRGNAVCVVNLSYWGPGEKSRIPYMWYRVFAADAGQLRGKQGRLATWSSAWNLNYKGVKFKTKSMSPLKPAQPFSLHPFCFPLTRLLGARDLGLRQIHGSLLDAGANWLFARSDWEPSSSFLWQGSKHPSADARRQTVQRCNLSISATCY